MLTQADLDFFHANGYLIMRGLISGRELELLQAAAGRVVEEGIGRVGEADHRYAKGPDGREVYWRSERMWERDEVFQAVTVNPDLLENIGQCVGQAFYPWNDSLVVKLPNAGAAVAWHQDPPYRNADRETTFAVPNFTTDVYLDHSGPDNGCVYAIPGYHLVGHVDMRSHSEVDLFARAVPLEMEPGDVLFHCLSTPHGSAANLSSSTRRVFYVHYLAEEVYQDGYALEAWAKEKPGWNNDRANQVEQMVTVRCQMGFESPAARETLQLGAEGFEFCGSPVTPRRHWADLAASIPMQRRHQMKKLLGGSAAAAGR